MSILERTDLRARMLQGALMAVVVTAINFGVRSAGGLDTISAPQKLLLLALCAGGGAVGGTVYFATDKVRTAGGWRKTAVNVVTILVFCAVTMVLVVVVTLAGLFGQ